MVIKGAGIMFSWPEPVAVRALQRIKLASYKATLGTPMSGLGCINRMIEIEFASSLDSARQTGFGSHPYRCADPILGIAPQRGCRIGRVRSQNRVFSKGGLEVSAAALAQQVFEPLHPFPPCRRGYGLAG
ncbi:hypothetical protein ACF8FB_10070 [Pseudomonas sp. yb_2]|uniref:hypothetical protein n=1 Tax=Pseudomonas sp. yb_2 TaxID=3367218 RepID=UPI00370BA09F